MVLYLKTTKMKTIIQMRKLTTNQKQLIAFVALMTAAVIACLVFHVKIS